MPNTWELLNNVFDFFLLIRRCSKVRLLERRNDTTLLICNLFGAAQKYCWAQELLPQPQSPLAIFNSNRRRRPFRFWHESETVKTCTKWRCSTNFYWPPIWLQFSSKNFNDMSVYFLFSSCVHTSHHVEKEESEKRYKKNSCRYKIGPHLLFYQSLSW